MNALILLSGGVDSTVLLSLALDAHRKCYALSFDYGQRHIQELQAAKNIAHHFEIPHIIIQLPDFQCHNCSLTSSTQVPKDRSMKQMTDGSIPNTYVPARNILFMSYAAQQADLIDAKEIYFGANASDQSAYPDCRPEFINAFQRVLDLGTRQGSQGKAPQIQTPLIYWKKGTIICQGDVLRTPFELTWSCYDPQDGGLHCGCCDACIYRQRGFIAADVKDPTPYANKKVAL